MLKSKLILSAALVALSTTGAFAYSFGIPGERNPHPIYGPGAQTSWYEGGVDQIAARAPQTNGRPTARSNNALGGFAKVNPYQGRAEVVAPSSHSGSGYFWGPQSQPGIYGGGF